MAVALGAVLAGPSSAHAQIGGYIRQIGGVWIDAEGLLRNIQPDETNQLRALREKAVQPLVGGIEQNGELRKISLCRLEAAIAAQLKTGKPLADEIKFLAGLQQIKYVFVYPEQHDIVLAGPAEGWKVSPKGEIVGTNSGRPVLLLDDLLVALRGSEECRESGIYCSIDPTAEGLVRLKALVTQLTKGGSDIATATGEIEETLGPQTITVGGVPAGSHFARVLVAADYRMKRLAMGFEPAPIKGLPSFLQLSKAGRGMRSMQQRWWLEPDYDSVLADENGLAWQIRGAHVRAATEEDVLTQTGARERTGKANPGSAKKWADNMTRHYEELAIKEPIFGQLRNCIDLAIVAALISKEGLLLKADCSLPVLYGHAELPSEEFPAPRQVSTQVSLLQKGANWLISASGGVKLNPWTLLEECKSTTELGVPCGQAEAKPVAENKLVVELSRACECLEAGRQVRLPVAGLTFSLPIRALLPILTASPRIRIPLELVSNLLAEVDSLILLRRLPKIALRSAGFDPGSLFA